MSHASFNGKHFQISNKSITIMKLPGTFMGQDWAIGFSFSSDDYTLVQVSPAPALAQILKVVQQDKEEGNFKDIRLVAISNRVAVRLWLEGILKREDLETAIEGETSVPYIFIPKVVLGEYTFSVAILPETSVGVGHICTLDKRLFIVGGGTEAHPYLPSPTNQPLLLN